MRPRFDVYAYQKHMLYTLNYIVFIEKQKQKSLSHRFLTSRQPCVGVRVVGNRVGPEEGQQGRVGNRDGA